VREIVIVIRDLYLGAATEPPPSGTGAAARVSAPGIAHLARFGTRAPLPEGWRAWAARWLGLGRYAAEPPASIAAAALAQMPAHRAVWLATPVHLMAGLTSLHFDRRSVLRLQEAELEALTDAFRETFRDSGFDLHPLGGGELLLSAPAGAAAASTTEPARIPLLSVAEALPAGEGAGALRRLGAEIEMWLHGHPINEARARRGAPPIATLWVWGGGAPAVAPAAAAQAPGDAAYGSDPYVRGLWRLAGGEARPMPVDWAALIAEPRAQRTLGVVEVAELLHAHASWGLADAVAEIDRVAISPSLAALHRGELDRLVLLANDRSLTVRAADRWRLWRRAPTSRNGLEGLE
jgi:hypothetical protein